MPMIFMYTEDKTASVIAFNNSVDLNGHTITLISTSPSIKSGVIIKDSSASQTGGFAGSDITLNNQWRYIYS